MAGAKDQQKLGRLKERISLAFILQSSFEDSEGAYILLASAGPRSNLFPQLEQPWNAIRKGHEFSGGFPRPVRRRPGSRLGTKVNAVYRFCMLDASITSGPKGE